MRSVELFSGCGGLAMGLSRAGFSHDLLLEWNADAVATVEHNRAAGTEHVADWPVERADVREFDFAPFRGRLDILAGGPPCQPFSLGGRARGHLDDRDMWPASVRAVAGAMPRAFLFENVKGLARVAFADYLAWIVEGLSRPGSFDPAEPHADALARLRASTARREYAVRVLRVDAADFGAPQRRHRVLVVGFRSDVAPPAAPLLPTHSRERLLWDQWVDGSYWTRHGLPVPSEARIARADLAAVLRLRSGGVAPAGLPWVTLRDAVADLGEPDGSANHVFQPGARAYPGHTGSPLDMPAKALKAGVHGVPGGENMMVRDDGTVRYLTIREAARLQGLPDGYAFPRSWSESMRQLGNAVPAQLGEAVGGWMAGALRDSQAERLAA